VDLNYLHEISEGNADFERAILQVFVTNNHHHLQIVRAALIDRDFGTIEHHIHEIESASTNVGAISIAKLALQVEELITNDNSDSTEFPDRATIAPLLNEIERLTHSIDRLYQS
jgi:HPt (histidine-containing phosphotransfer) domain-containing protein